MGQWERNPLGRSAKLILIGALVILPCIFSAQKPAAARTEVRGHPENLQLQVENASIKEVLNALGTTFKLKYKLPANVSRELTGQYSGTLRQVLARILDGSDYVLQLGESTAELVVFGSAGSVGGTGHSVMRVTEKPAEGPAPAAAPTIPPPKSSPPANQSPPPLASYLTANTPN